MAIEYERVNWDTTKYVNPTNMNQMDAGIKAACDGVDENGTQITSINSNLHNKFDSVTVTSGAKGVAVTVSYPQGFNQNNCVLIGSMLWDNNSNVWRTYGQVSDSIPVSFTTMLGTSNIFVETRHEWYENKQIKIALMRTDI